MSPFSHARYDVAIAGASFAGLATALAAAGASGRILLLDHRPIGEGQTSACGTTLQAMAALDALETVQQVHDDLVLHLTPAAGPERVLNYRLPYRFATFDYGALCRLLARRAQDRGVEFVQARALGWEHGVLRTDRGAIPARCVVDATGWRAAVASSIDPRYVRRDRLSCGLEAELPQPPANRAQGLHFWAGQGTVWPGYAWSFPAGNVARLGVIAYGEDGEAPRPWPLAHASRGEGNGGGALYSPSPRSGRGGRGVRGAAHEGEGPGVRGASSQGLREALDAFLDGPGAAYWSPDGKTAWTPGSGTPGSGTPTAGRHLHGGFLPAAPRRPVVGPVFAVGDAAGHCFGLTGEGIRPALALASRCGRLLRRVNDGQITPAQARRAYARYVALRAPYFHLMRTLQRLVSHMTDRGLARYSLWAHPGPIFRFLMGQYLWPTK